MQEVRKAGETAQKFRLQVFPVEGGAPISGITPAHITKSYFSRPGTAPVDFDLSAVAWTAAWQDNDYGWAENPKEDGDYEFHVPDEAVAVGAQYVTFMFIGEIDSVDFMGVVGVELSGQTAEGLDEKIDSIANKLDQLSDNLNDLFDAIPSEVAEAIISDTDHKIPTAAAGVGVGSIGEGALSDSSIAPDARRYSALVSVSTDESEDRWSTVFMKDGSMAPVADSPDIWVVRDDGQNLIGTDAAPVALSQVSSFPIYVRVEGASRIVRGRLYFARVRGTIDSEVREFFMQVGRDVVVS